MTNMFPSPPSFWSASMFSWTDRHFYAFLRNYLPWEGIVKFSTEERPLECDQSKR